MTREKTSSKQMPLISAPSEIHCKVQTQHFFNFPTRLTPPITPIS